MAKDITMYESKIYDNRTKIKAKKLKKKSFISLKSVLLHLEILK